MLDRMFYAIGWDIGGAHVKVCVCDNHKIINVYQVACPLWQGLDQLEQALETLIKKLPCNKPQHHAVTMTGELVDTFTNRHEGVYHILQTLKILIRDHSNLLSIFCGPSGLVAFDKIDDTYFDRIASTNWLASALFGAKQFPYSLFVDVGSTTTDILLCENGIVQTDALSDYDRLISQELIYTGIVRTPVMAVVYTVTEDDHEVGVIAEYFATMADVYRIIGKLKPSHDQTATADGRLKTIPDSARRLSRMIGADFKPEELSRWQTLATQIYLAQRQRIENACLRQLNKKSTPPKYPFIGAGIGRFLVEEIAQHLECPYIDFTALIDQNPSSDFNAGDCAPAAAVAQLIYQY